MQIEYKKEKAFWRKYTDDNLTDEDIDEINQNLLAFAEVLLDFHEELNSKEK